MRLADGEASVNEIAAPFDVTLPAISRHIKVLEQAGLVTQGKRAQYRPCKIEASPLKEISAWTEQYRPIWEARFDGWTITYNRFKTTRKRTTND